jgi:DNA mismatch repair protein MutS2
VGEPADLESATELAEAIEAVVDGAGRVRDGASETLAELETEVRDKRAEVEAALAKLAASRKLRDGVAEPEQSHYSGPRRVLALKPEAADRVKGVRREALDGGKGILVEPMEVVPANNRLEQLGRQIDQEQRRLLRELTDGVRERGDALQRLVDAVAWIDLALAGGRLSREMDAAAPELTDRPELILHGACHPALVTEAKNGGPAAVPFDLELDAERPMVLITGPNTGGKTVVVKTAGLLAVMAHCGLHIPAAEGSRVGSYRRLVVDIGDPQSLANHVSTFAGHVEALKGILAEADERTLVLLDELGTGTDPEEGAALAMAVLEELSERGVQALLTTHLSPLKSFADEHAGIRNANMRFDHERLAPTYHLEVGRPGASLGLVVAEQGGLEAGVLERARGHLRRLRPEGE